MCAPNRPSHAWPRLLESKYTLDIVPMNFFSGDRIDDSGLDAKEGERGRPGLRRCYTAKGRDDMGAGFCLPVCLYVLASVSTFSLRSYVSLTSTTCASSFPTISKYHFQTSAAIGSPTDPRILKLFISCLTCWSPARLSSRRAVGAT